MPLPFSIISTTSQDVLEDADSDEEAETFYVNWITEKFLLFKFESFIIKIFQKPFVSTINGIRARRRKSRQQC